MLGIGVPSAGVDSAVASLFNLLIRWCPILYLDGRNQVEEKRQVRVIEPETDEDVAIKCYEELHRLFEKLTGVVRLSTVIILPPSCFRMWNLA